MVTNTMLQNEPNNIITPVGDQILLAAQTTKAGSASLFFVHVRFLAAQADWP